MKSITLKTLLFGLFLIAALGVNAQEASGSYEYAEISIWQVKTSELRVKVLYSEKETEVLEPAIKSNSLIEEQRVAMLKAVGEKVKENWTVYAVDKDTYYLRRKKK